ncbi:cysteine-rich KTR domain-containing protein [Alkalibaculum sporogenes]
MIEEKRIICPVCQSKTRIEIREDTKLETFTLFCPKCNKKDKFMYNT